jgi:hypothetical protein
MSSYLKVKPYRNEKLLRMAKEAPCACCGSYGTTVSAHSNWHDKGMSIKASDCYIAHLCFTCHSELDQGKNMTKDERKMMWLEAMAKTYHWLMTHNYLIINPIGNTHGREFQ